MQVYSSFHSAMLRGMSDGGYCCKQLVGAYYAKGGAGASVRGGSDLMHGGYSSVKGGLVLHSIPPMSGG